MDQMQGLNYYCVLMLMLGTMCIMSQMQGLKYYCVQMLMLGTVCYGENAGTELRLCSNANGWF